MVGSRLKDTRSMLDQDTIIYGLFFHLETFEFRATIFKLPCHQAKFIRKGSRLDIAYSLGNTDLHWTVDISGLAGD